MTGVCITAVEEGGIAHELGIAVGDVLLSINNETIQDIFDYRFQMAEEEIQVVIRKPDGTQWTLDIEKEESDDLGLSFEQPLMDAEKRCTNDCVFCFIDQLPPNMRETLYFKDDDARLSFLYGNYITMTNLKEAEIDRIIRYRMSPINVSVHTTNPDLRVKMLGNRFAGNIMERVKKLTDAGITVNAQIVLCRDLNDGAELERTLADLETLCPQLHSVSVVPVGLSKHRDGLYPLVPFDKETSKTVLQQIHTWQQKLLAQFDTRTVYAADEFYIMAGEPLPVASNYEDFPQIENGVGMLASFLDECHAARQEALPKACVRTVSIATGTSAAPYIKQAAEALEACVNGLQVFVYPIENRFFGGHVSVTGLLTGTDLLEQLADVSLGDALLLCRSMFRADTETMLDDVERAELETRLGIPVMIVDNDGYAFTEAVVGIRSIVE